MFEFPKVEKPRDFQYKHNFLKSVIFQVKYPFINKVVNNIPLLKDRLGKLFKNSGEIFKSEVGFKFEEKTPILQSTKSLTQGIEFRSDDGYKILAITEDSITYTIFGASYSNFENTTKELQQFFSNILDELGIKTLNRIAIRKINIIELEILQQVKKNDIIQAVFNKPLVDSLNFIPSINYLASHISNNIYKKDTYQLNLNYGLVPNQNETSKWQFLLDIDLFSLTSDFVSSDLINEFQNINDEIFNIFNWALLDSVKNSLNQE